MRARWLKNENVDLDEMTEVTESVSEPTGKFKTRRGKQAALEEQVCGIGRQFSYI